MARLVALLLLAQAAVPALADYGGHDLFTSLGQIMELWKNERAAIADMEEAIVRIGEIKSTLEKYVRSHRATKLDQEPTIKYVGHPLNAYFLIRHVALGWEEIREKAFQAENATRIIFGRTILLKKF